MSAFEVYETAKELELMGNDPLNALSDLWTDSGQSTEQLPAGLRLWHCGSISCQEALDDERALWTTRAAERQDIYSGWAKEAEKWNKTPAVKLELITRHALNAADFSSRSLLSFTNIFCDGDHTTMKRVLRVWLVANQFRAAVRLNRDPTEVVLVSPQKDAFVNSMSRI